MDAKTIILDIIMFAAYIANIIFIVQKCIKIPHGLKMLEEDCKWLNDHDTVTEHHKRFISPFFHILLGNLIFMIIGAVTCVNDGLSDMENLLVVPVWAIFFAGIIVSGFFIVYVDILRKKYSIRMVYKEDRLRLRGSPSGAQIIACLTAAWFFAFNTGFVAYTIALLLV
ncbi:MAG: hypothetical protein IJW96_05135 [Clostridia bacterium]|nr:hypothetical protein [Clostridia bacterium]